MIARHGYLTLSRDRELILDPSYHEEDEGIVFAILPTRLILLRPQQLLHEGVPETIPEDGFSTLRSSHKHLPMDCIDDVSVSGYSIMALLLAIDRNKWSSIGYHVAASREWIDGILQQVLCVYILSLAAGDIRKKLCHLISQRILHHARATKNEMLSSHWRTYYR